MSSLNITLQRFLSVAAITTTLFLVTPAAFAQLNYSFSTTSENWQQGGRTGGALPPDAPLASGGTLTYFATGGNTGGYIRVADSQPNAILIYHTYANQNMTNLIGGTFSFDARLISGGPATNTAFGRVRFYRSDGALPNSSADDQLAEFDIVPGSSSPTTSWANFSGTINATNFQVYSPTAMTLQDILSSVIRIEITTEAAEGTETVGIDNINATVGAVAVPEPGTVSLISLAGLTLLGAVVRTVRRRKTV